MNKPFMLTDQEKIDIVCKFNHGKTCNELSKEYNVRWGSIYKLLVRRKIIIPKDGPKYKVNEHYFDVIDTEEKAYFLGLLYADGCNEENKNTISIGLQENDKHILDKFTSEIQTDRPLLYITQKNTNHKNMFKLTIYSKHMSKRLSELGCWARKSLTLEFPNKEQIPECLLIHFIRGYWDGDGSHGLRNLKKYDKKSSIFANMVGTNKFCIKIQEFLNIYNIESIINIPNSDIINTTRKLNINKISSILTLLHLLYSNAKIYLNRKYEKYLEITNIVS